jgi:methylthioribulose-1-phosphate dehydratase
VWSTLLSEWGAKDGGIALEGYEVLAGIDGVATHQHREWIPIVDNTRDWAGRAHSIQDQLQRAPQVHALLIYRHGLYTWGHGLAAAKRHVEIFEFLLEIEGRKRFAPRGRD